MKCRFQSAENKFPTSTEKLTGRGGAVCCPYLPFLSAVSLIVFSMSPGFAQLNDYDARVRATQLYNESIGLINDGNVERAEPKLVEAYHLCPNDANILNNYGLVLMKLGKLPEARGALERAFSINPRFDAISLNLGLVCENQGDLVTAKKYLSNYLAIATDRNQAEKMRDHINIIDKTLARGGGTGGVSTDDYFGQMQPEQMHPWPKSRMPLKVYMASGDGVEGYKPSYGQDVENALNSYSQALNGLVSFERVKAEESADITVKWTHDPQNALLKAEGGDCKYTANGAGMSHANIQILTIDPSRSDRLNDFKVSWVALHEIGHALGIAAHSNSPDDIMYFTAPMKNAFSNLSSRDIKTLVRIYSEKLPDTWLSLNEEAIRALKTKEYDLAESKLEAAIKLAPEQKVLKGNLMLVQARICESLLNQDKNKEAEPHFVKALDMEMTERDDNFKWLVSNYAECLRRLGRDSEIDAMYKKYGASK